MEAERMATIVEMTEERARTAEMEAEATKERARTADGSRANGDDS